MSRNQHQWAFFLIAVWMTGTVAVALVAVENFYTVDRLLADTTTHVAFKDALAKLGAPAGRDLLLYLSSELNRLYLQWWNAIQILILGGVLWLLRPLGRGNRTGWYAVGMLAVEIFITLVLTPPLIRIGREIDFLPHDPRPAGLQTIALLYAAYTVFTLVNLFLSVLIIRGIRRNGLDEGGPHPWWL